MAAALSDFEKWLSEKLINANADIDLDIFVTYIMAILDDDTPYDEIKESLTELLSQVADSEKENLTASILEQWKIEREMSLPIPTSDSNDGKLSDLLVLQIQPDSTVSNHRNLTDEQKAVKAAILNQYAEIAEGDEDETGEHAADTTAFTRNVNSDTIAKAEREKREKSKQEAAAKKEKDKADRASQKQSEKDRKEGEKKRTQKGERKR